MCRAACRLGLKRRRVLRWEKPTGYENNLQSASLALALENRHRPLIGKDMEPEQSSGEVWERKNAQLKQGLVSFRASREYL